MWVRQGEGVLWVEQEPIPFVAPCVLAIPPGVVHEFRWLPGSDGYVVMMDAALLRAAAETLDPAWFERVLHASVKSQEELAAGFEGLARAFRTGGAQRAPALVGYSMVILAAFIECGEAMREATSPVSSASQLVQRYRQFIDEHFAEQPRIEIACDYLGVSQDRLTRACRTVTGKTPLGILHSRLLLEAQRQLTFSALSILEISYALGFSDPAYFSRFFRRHTGFSPKQWCRHPQRGVRAASSADGAPADTRHPSPHPRPFLSPEGQPTGWSTRRSCRS